MDEKYAKYKTFPPPAAGSPMRAHALRAGRFRPLLMLTLVVLCLYLYAKPSSALGPLPDMSPRLSNTLQVAMPGSAPGADTNAALVPLEAHIMSKCPDARDCLQKLILPAMVRIVDKVNFTLSFIGTPTENDGIDCMHGPEECLGNIMLLCAEDLYPDPKTYLGFSMCLMKDYQHIPQRNLIEDCALEHAIDFGKLDKCASKDDGAWGVEMLRNSVRRSSDAGVTKSCTVRLDEEFYCVRDGGEWTDCPHGAEVNDLVLAIEKKYRA
ncbi:hypothetical protein DHEL01_v205828 [Diaporthe helianthi]|uniref:Gamma interferon inducible lysosomal thiol reductase n=1 Tax=Diaporthe helianthi TaxID=158607 RepID=A0A2P5HZU4_DIAHE|nr:hypothetical protein DHEL01_v205828 [Diaporthe helianthi]